MVGNSRRMTTAVHREFSGKAQKAGILPVPAKLPLARV
jgi:hypothetical protein